MAGDDRRFVVVGAGQAGAWIVRTLRSEGFEGRVVLIGEEPHWPYERPPLSKSVLVGAVGENEGVLLTAGQAAELGIETWLEQSVVAIDRERRSLVCAGGRSIGFDTLFLATGGRARTLPEAEALGPDHLHHLRTRNDAERLKAILKPRQRLVVIGGGWIGLEVAASARKLSVEVTIVEAAPRVCARSVPQQVSDYIQSLHRSNGVDLRLSAAAARISVGPGGGVEAVLGDASRIDADYVLVGIGVSPNAELAERCGLEVENGVVVDEGGRTSDPNIYAAGDVTRHFNRLAGKHIRLESWANAQDQGVVAARAALGQPVIYDKAPWHWSDQFGVNFQILGFPEQGARVLTRGTPAAGNGSWLVLDEEGAALGAVSVNAPRDLRELRKALNAGRAPDLSAWAA